ncbi:uncharacterized protein N7511_009197 [Penicillium nucicola]|uniref:uncharacterized protein n=1 Tax=Penicillium nucicola TaxID=1850975 RepID=UPI002545395C|nr:uncharacterized protein N7511_009197 [Penicillium nucicola]KAJ5747501.1 hypothetical protein N7511_009197 [Penicillium nucicola]
MPSEQLLSRLPEFTLPPGYKPAWEHENPLFPTALDQEAWIIYVYREILMMRLMNTITDKPEWDHKVYNEEITNKWRQEVSQGGQDVTEIMMDWVIKELQWKAEVLQNEGLTFVFDIGVIKSDTAIPEDLKRLLKDAVAPFEAVPEEQKDYHPGTNNKVVDLVHQSLFPVVYGHTHILRDKTIGLEDCLSNVGQGELLSAQNENPPAGYSGKFQWLPCDVALLEYDECRITSYISNAHPVEHQALYEVVEKIIARAIPLWNKSLTSPSYDVGQRIPYDTVEYLDDCEHKDPRPVEKDFDNENEYWEKCDEWDAAQPIKQPEPYGRFKAPDYQEPGNWTDLRSEFRESGLQVMVKLANIELTPEDPEYEGGSWHIEGQLNEHICATAIYYYDCENITESTLCFRGRGSEEPMEEISYEQERHEFLQQVYGFAGNGTNIKDLTQELGGVVCKEGRLLTFPNVVQHRVSPFSLADRSRPGHRKILALFLVDPHIRIISSANVPPQREDWGVEREKVVDGALSKLPVELQYMVRKDLPKNYMTMDEAKQYRLELMKERSVQTRDQNNSFESGSFSLCEH